jgi:hypothetical protein
MTELELLKEHIHDGLETKKINASVVELNSGNFKNVRDITVSEALKTLDKIIDDKQNKIDSKGIIGLLKIDDKGNISIIDVNNFEFKNHKHNDYLTKSKIKDGNLIVYSNDALVDSQLNPNNLVIKEELVKVLQNFNQIMDVQKKHEHNNYFQKFIGNKTVLVVDQDKNFVQTGISTNDVILKNDFEEYKKQMTNEIKILKDQLYKKSNANHSHAETDKIYIKHEDFKEFLKKSLIEILK